MFWDKKKIIVLGILGALSLLAYVVNRDTGPGKTLDLEPDYFAVIDSASVRTITLAHANQNVELSAASGTWLVNRKHRASELNLTRLLYIIKHVRAKRELSSVNAKTVIEAIKKEGITVKVYDNEKLLKEFIIDQGDVTTSSCFYDIKTQKAYFVELPSVTDDFSSFFKTDANYWRSRLISTNSMKSLERLTSNLKGKLVTFTYKDSFFEISPKVKDVDSNTVGMYLIQFRNLECDAYLEDSLQHLCTQDLKKAFGSVSIKDVDSTKNNTLYFFDIPSRKRQFLGYSSKQKECFWLAKNKALDLLIETEKLFEKQKPRQE